MENQPQNTELDRLYLASLIYFRVSKDNQIFKLSHLIF